MALRMACGAMCIYHKMTNNETLIAFEGPSGNPPKLSYHKKGPEGPSLIDLNRITTGQLDPECKSIRGGVLLSYALPQRQGARGLTPPRGGVTGESGGVTMRGVRIKRPLVYLIHKALLTHEEPQDSKLFFD